MTTIVNVSLDDLAAAADPFVATVPAADAVFHFVRVGSLLEMSQDGRSDIIEVRRVDTGVALLDAIADFVLGVAQQRFPALGIVHLASGHVAVPDAGAAAVDGQCHAAFGLAQHIQLATQAGVRLLPRQQAGRHLGQLSQHMLLSQVRPGSKYCSRACSNKNARSRYKQRKGGEREAA